MICQDGQDESRIVLPACVNNSSEFQCMMKPWMEGVSSVHSANVMVSAIDVRHNVFNIAHKQSCGHAKRQSLIQSKTG